MTGLTDRGPRPPDRVRATTTGGGGCNGRKRPPLFFCPAPPLLSPLPPTAAGWSSEKRQGRKVSGESPLLASGIAVPFMQIMIWRETKRSRKTCHSPPARARKASRLKTNRPLIPFPGWTISINPSLHSWALSTSSLSLSPLLCGHTKSMAAAAICPVPFTLQKASSLPRRMDEAEGFCFLNHIRGLGSDASSFWGPTLQLQLLRFMGRCWRRDGWRLEDEGRKGGRGAGLTVSLFRSLQ